MKFLIRTHGCRANQYDSEAARRLLLQNGGVEVTDPRQAEVAIFNSCSVTAAAEAELRKDVRRAARRNPRLRSIVIGCAPGLSVRDERAAPLRSLPTVTDTLPGADLHAIGATLGFSRSSRDYAQTGARALLRIQDGCDEHCTFCATTLARGASRSRSVTELTAEAGALARDHPEIVLTGIHIGSYGADIGSTLSDLVESLITSVPGVRFRLSSLEATEVDDRLRDLFDEPARLAPYLHAPLQSGSNRVLKRMGRHWYSAESYASRIGQIVAGRTVFGLGADVMTGFPGETEEDHRATISLVESLPFTYLHVFRYSPRPGTSALRLDGDVAAVASERRSAELRELAMRKAAVYESSRDGGVGDIVAISSREGLTEDYLSVDLTRTRARRRERFTSSLSMGESGLMATPTPNERE